MRQIFVRSKASMLAVFAFLAVQVAAMVGFLKAMPKVVRRELDTRGFRQASEGQFAIGIIMGVVGAIVLFVAVLLILSAFSPTMFGSVRSINENITEESTGSDEVDSLAPVFVLLIALSFLLAIVSAVLGAAALLQRRLE